MQKTIYLILLFTFVAPQAYTDPVYLDCRVGEDSNDAFAVKIDEDTGKITHTWASNDVAFNAEGFFAPETITYQSTGGTSDLKISTQIRIDRTDLSFVKTFAIQALKPAFDSMNESRVNHGSCSIVEVPDRKI